MWQIHTFVQQSVFGNGQKLCCYTTTLCVLLIKSQSRSKQTGTLGYWVNDSGSCLRMLHSAWGYNPICPYECVKTSDLRCKTTEEAYRPAKMASDYGMNLLQSSSDQLIRCNKSLLHNLMFVSNPHGLSYSQSQALNYVCSVSGHVCLCGVGDRWQETFGWCKRKISIINPMLFQTGTCQCSVCHSFSLVEQMTNVGCCHMMTTEGIILTHLIKSPKWDV